MLTDTHTPLLWLLGIIDPAYMYAGQTHIDYPRAYVDGEINKTTH
jgi:hypothetical protein